MAKNLIIVGILLIVLGIGWPLLQKLNIGRLPGDFVFKSGSFRLYFPLMTCIIISVIVTVLLWIFRK